MLNFEVKTKILNCTEFLEKIRRIGAVYKETMNQIDYYFQIGDHKEKIREINHKTIQFISYDRSETRGRKNSKYNIKTLSPDQKELLLKQKIPICVVSKTRQLWIYKNTRIHLDNVAGLGNFMELETVIKNISKKQGASEFNEVIDKLKIKPTKSEPFSYSDLILNQTNVSRINLGSRI